VQTEEQGGAVSRSGLKAQNPKENSKKKPWKKGGNASASDWTRPLSLMGAFPKQLGYWHVCDNVFNECSFAPFIGAPFIPFQSLDEWHVSK
jgi:hypothetical protein